MPENRDDSDVEKDPGGDVTSAADMPMNNSSRPDAADADVPTMATDAVTAERCAEPASTAAQRDEVFNEFREAVRSCGAPDLASRKWGFLKEQNRGVRIDMPPSEFVAALELDYAVDTLVAFGFYERVAGEVRLPSWLGGDPPIYVNVDDEDTIRFSRGNEFLFPMVRTALEHALERIPPDAGQTTQTLFVVDSPDSIDVMQRLGLRAVSSEGLESLGRHEISNLFSDDPRSDVGWRYHLLLVDFDVAQLDIRPTAAIGEVIQRLITAQDVYNIDPARRFGVCRPNVHEFHRLEQAILFKDSDLIAEMFETWAASARSLRIHNWRTHLVTETASYSVARAELARALELGDVARRFAVSTALPAYLAACHTAVTEKFYGEIGRAGDPYDEFDQISAAEYAETFVALDPLVRAAEAVMAGRCPPKIYEVQDELSEKRERCIIELRRIRRDRKAKR
jgi:hypothetical protein